MRLNKYISETGICSRREADQWIEQGRVTINHQTAVLGTQVNDGDEVHVNGRLLGVKKKDVYIALNKPVGITCTTERHVEGNIVDFVGHRDRIFPIGRLDKDSEGLILLTNNGDIVNQILRSEHNHEKEYIVTVDKPVTPEFIHEMALGVRILDTVTKPCQVRQTGKNRFQIILTQGLNRQIRRMCEAFDYQVRSLQRIRIMNVHLDGIAVGTWRALSPSELDGLLPKLTDVPRVPKPSPWDLGKRTLSLKSQTPRNSHK
jgi:23S rRNA pseudouridine2604 synthase